ncbi:hypothetical protein Bbelb_261980 [Branchiostoma belcheri]|nr:hypothetical protein Bbelb_436210 [Branchiostoma belcheri]KAI8495782.1 hypothetical protein Bbelb_261980 [Branchiostoma belcheri]
MALSSKAESGQCAEPISTCREVVDSYKHLGITLTNTLSWSKHVETTCTKSRRSAGLLCALRKKVPMDILLRLYKTITRPGLEYADIVWAGLTKSDESKLESVQYQTARLISGQHGLPYPSYQTLYTQLSLPSLQFRRRFHTATTLYKLLNGHCPPHLQTLVPRTRESATDKTTLSHDWREGRVFSNLFLIGGEFFPRELTGSNRRDVEKDSPGSFQRQLPGEEFSRSHIRELRLH